MDAMQSQRTRELIHRSADAAIAKFRNAVRPIYRINDDRPEHIGSSVLAEIDDHRFLLTAAHVLDELGDSMLYVGGMAHLAPMENEFFATSKVNGRRDDDHYDFAFSELRDHEISQLGSVRYISLEEMAPSRIGAKGALFTVAGFPCSRNKASHIAGSSIKGQLFQYSNSAAGPRELAATHFGRSEDHIFIPYRKFSNDIDGRKVKTMKPIGLSGGAVFETWKFNDAPTIFQPRLAGITIERPKHSETIVATKIGVIVSAIRKVTL